MPQARAEIGAELIAEAIREYGSAQFRVQGSSMRPLLRAGDVIEVKREALGGMRRGDVAVFARAGGIFAHRVIRTSGSRGTHDLLTKGDAFPDADEPVNGAELLGRVTGVVRGGRRTSLDSPQQRMLGQVLAAVSAAAPVWYPPARAAKRALRAAFAKSRRSR